MTTSSLSVSAVPVRRRGLIDGIWAAARLSGLRLVKGRRGILLILLGVVPLIPVLVSNLLPLPEIKGILGFAFAYGFFRVVSGLVCLFLGCAALGEEIEGKTLSYLTVRAIPRTSLVIGRYLAYVVSATCLLIPPLIACYVATVAPMGAEALTIDLPYLFAVIGATALGVAAYGGVFMLVAVTIKRPLLVGIGLLFAWEAWVVFVPRPLSDYTVLHHVYVVLFHWTGLPTFYELAGWRDPDDFQTAGGSVIALLCIAGFSVLLAALRFKTKEY